VYIRGLSALHANALSFPITTRPRASAPERPPTVCTLGISVLDATVTPLNAKMPGRILPLPGRRNFFSFTNQRHSLFLQQVGDTSNM